MKKKRTCKPQNNFQDFIKDSPLTNSSN